LLYYQNFKIVLTNTHENTSFREIRRKSMKNKAISMLIVLLLVMSLTSTASAGGNVGFKSVTFSLGSLDMTGTLTGLGGYTDGVQVDLTATGTPVVTCVSPGGKDSPPGQNPSQVSATATQTITQIFKNGTASVSVSAEPALTGVQGGCSNNNWTARIDFVYWTHATVVVTDLSNNGVLLHQEYSCITTRNPASVSCTLVP
jgi:hypothetical protein